MNRTTSTITTPAPAPVAPRHSLLEDALGLLTGTLLASFGLFLLKTAEAVTGGATPSRR